MHALNRREQTDAYNRIKQRRKPSLSEGSNYSTGVLARGLEEKRTCGERHQKTGRQTSIVCGYFLFISKYFWYIYLNKYTYLYNKYNANIYISMEKQKLTLKYVIMKTKFKSIIRHRSTECHILQNP